MTSDDLQVFVDRCRAFLHSLVGIISDDDRQWALHLIESGEPAEGVCSAAWSLEDGGADVTPWIGVVSELTSGLVPRESLPPSFRR
jgi:hypothetical protein